MIPILFLHGALASKSQFDEMLNMLPETIKADAINFSGHGGKLPALTGYTFQTFANDILEYADANKLDKLNLFGYSMGGYAALYFAKLYPERVNRIFMLNVKFNWDMESTEKEIAMLNAENMLLKVPGFANNLMMQHGLNMWKQVVQQTGDMMQQLASKVMLTDADFKQIKCPVLLSVGDRDHTAGLEQTLSIYRKLPNASLWVIPNTAHVFEQVDREALHHQLLRFFSEV